MNMFGNSRRITLPSLTVIGLMTIVMLASISQAHAANIALSNFSVTPDHAPRGGTVTASVTVQNFDTGQPVTVVVTIYDEGIPVASNSASPVTVPHGQSETVTIQFTTRAAAPHCYAADSNPGSSPVGFCEAGGRILGGISMPAFDLGFAIVAATVAAAMVGLIVASNRRRLA